MLYRGRIWTPDPVGAHGLNEGLVAWWLGLPELSGGPNLFDLGGRYKGTLTNGPLWAPGPNGFAAVSFDGSDDRIDLPAQWSVANGLTYSAWIRPATISSGFYAIRANKKTILVYRGTAVSWWADSDLSQVDVSFTFVAGRDYHVAVTQVGTAYTVYVNGTAVGSGTTNALDDTSDKANIGSFGGSFLFAGLITDVRDYNRVLSAGEMWALYEQGRGGYPDLLDRVSSKVWSFPAVTPAADNVVWLLRA